MLPPPPSLDGGNVLLIMWWSLKLRYWAVRHDHFELTRPDIPDDLSFVRIGAATTRELK